MMLEIKGLRIQQDLVNENTRMTLTLCGRCTTLKSFGSYMESAEKAAEATKVSCRKENRVLPCSLTTIMPALHRVHFPFEA